jgi:hypothetical protein
VSGTRGSTSEPGHSHSIDQGLWCVCSSSFHAVLSKYSNGCTGPGPRVTVFIARGQALKFVDYRLAGTGSRDHPTVVRPSLFLCTLSLTGQHPAAGPRARELAPIHQLFVPGLTLRLHTLLISSRTNLSECFVTSVSTPFALSPSLI